MPYLSFDNEMFMKFFEKGIIKKFSVINRIHLPMGKVMNKNWTSKHQTTMRTAINPALLIILHIPITNSPDLCITRGTIKHVNAVGEYFIN
ncbi:MAG: hypothetical protein WC855_10160 [Thermodesulfovibrionales bacterium]